MLSLDATIDKYSTGHSEQQQTETRLARSLKELQTYLIKVLHLHLFIFRWQIFKNFLTQLSHLISGHLSQLVGSCRMKLADFWHGWILLPRRLHEKLEDEVSCFCVTSEGFLFGFTFSCQQQRVAENGGGWLLWRFCQSRLDILGAKDYLHRRSISIPPTRSTNEVATKYDFWIHCRLVQLGVLI